VCVNGQNTVMWYLYHGIYTPPYNITNAIRFNKIKDKIKEV